MAGELTWQELHEQPGAWAQTLRNTAPFEELNTLETSVYLGSGVALYVGRCAAALTQASGGPRSYSIPAQDAFAFTSTVASRQPTLYVMIARTGDVSDAVRGMRALRNAPGFRVAVIGEEGGPLADLADRAVAVRVHEESVVTTKTLTSMLLALQLGMWRALDHPYLGGMGQLPDLVSRLLPQYDTIAREEAGRDYDEIVVLGSGPYYGLAEAGALTIREMSLSHTVAHHALVYPHGHKVTMTEQTLVIFYVSDSARQDEHRIVQEVRTMGARSIAIGEGATELGADVTVETACGLNEWQRLVLYPPFAQLFGYHHALRRGLDPDRPRHLPKVF